MCGIWASIGLTVSPSVMERVSHRGPDGGGWRTFACPWGEVALGSRRLAIIDTSDHGLQPMSEPTGRYWLTYNGEIYNYRELRTELEGLGVAFGTQTDSEVLLHALIRWGEGALDRLCGMFAFALWDDREKTLLVARDRFGIKPLYVAETPRGIAFASEIKQLHDLAGLPGRMNAQRLRDFLATGTIDHTRETMFAGIGQLRGGELALLDTAKHRPGDPLRVRRWYTLPPPGSSSAGCEEAATQYAALLEDSVRLHLRTDVPLGSCLSGGLDSSSIVCLMQRLAGRESFGGRLATVSAVFAEPRVDERRYVEAVIEATGARPRYVTFGPDDILGVASDIAWFQDEPFGSTSIIAQWHVFRAAHQEGLKVMLDGQGADEQLGGYHWLFGTVLAGLVRAGRLAQAWRMIETRVADHGVSRRAQLLRAAPHLLPRGLEAAARRLVRPTNWLGSAFHDLAPQPEPFDRAAEELGLAARSDLGSMASIMTMATSLPMLLHWEDRSSMAHSIEARVPFLDHRLVEFAIALGERHKTVGAETKVLLRRAMADVLPPIILDRKDKIGFATPEQEWFRKPLAQAVRAGVEDTLRAYPDLLDRSATLALVDATLRGDRAFDEIPWRILILGVWGRRFGLSL